MSVTFPVSLGKVEVITERPFTHTDHITKDRDILIHMAKEASLILEKKLNLLEERKTVFIDEPDDRYHRFFISKPLI